MSGDEYQNIGPDRDDYEDIPDLLETTVTGIHGASLPAPPEYANTITVREEFEKSRREDYVNIKTGGEKFDSSMISRKDSGISEGTRKSGPLKPTTCDENLNVKPTGKRYDPNILRKKGDHTQKTSSHHGSLPRESKDSGISQSDETSEAGKRNTLPTKTTANGKEKRSISEIIEKKENETHKFHLDPSRNRDHPSWFFEGCSRGDAETVLMLGKKYGNVLLRESVTFRSTGSYVITMRREVQGGTTINHYEVMKNADGFKLNVDNPHAPMKCLSEVMEFFVSVAGPGTKPMNTNDRAVLGLPPAPGQPQYDDDSGIVDSLDNHVDTRAPSVGGKQMTIQGQVPPEMLSALNTMGLPTSKGTPQSSHSTPGGYGQDSYNRQDSYGRQQNYDGYNRQDSYGRQDSYNRQDSYGRQDSYNTNRQDNFNSYNQGPSEAYENFGNDGHPQSPTYSSHSQNDQWSTSHQSNTTSGPPPPPPPPLPTMGFDNPALNMTVPPKSAPTETLQRQAGHTDIQRGMDELYLNSDQSSSIPPPLPTNHPTSGRSPYNRQDSGGMAGQSPFMSNAQVSTAPRPSMGGGGGMSFEDELKKRLKSQKEDIYASGATVHRSGNW